MVLRVWVAHEGDGSFPQALAALCPPGVDLVIAPQRPEPADYDALVAGRPTADDLDASARLRWLVVPWAGLPPVTRDLARARPRLAVHNLHHNAAATAEMAIALLLAAARRVVVADQALRRGDWRHRDDSESGMGLAGRRALVLGLGAIGRRIAEVLAALGADVRAVRRRPEAADGRGPPQFGPADLDRLLPEADVLVIALPATAGTRGLLDAARLARLPRHAVLVNVARGDIVDEQALFEALTTGQLRAAGLDVWWRYPKSAADRVSTPPSSLPFHALDNVVLSPHRAGHAAGIETERARHLADLLAAAATGRSVPNRVDVEQGY